MIENNWVANWALFFLGAVTGLAYISFLWFSVKKISRNPHSAFSPILGFFIRIGSLGISLFFVAKWFHFFGILFYLAGFFIMQKVGKRKYYEYHS